MTAATHEHTADRKATALGLLLIHPDGSAILCSKGEGELARSLILAGWNPIGPKGKAAAERIRDAA